VVKDSRGGHAEGDHVDEVGHDGTRDFGAGDPLEALVPAAAIFLRIVTGDQPRLVHRLLPRAEVGTLLLGHHLDSILRQTKRRWCRTVLLEPSPAMLTESGLLGRVFALGHRASWMRVNWELVSGVFAKSQCGCVLAGGRSQPRLQPFQ